MPTQKLKLKIGAPIILLRNININHGLCNGTRLLITDLTTNLIYADITTGTRVGQNVQIPRIYSQSGEDSGLPFTLKRKQFPVSLGFCMTINLI